MVRTSDLRGQNRVLSFPGVRTRAKYGKKKKKTKNKKNSFVFALLVIKQYKNDGFLFFLMNVWYVLEFCEKIDLNLSEYVELNED